MKKTFLFLAFIVAGSSLMNAQQASSASQVVTFGVHRAIRLHSVSSLIASERLTKTQDPAVALSVAVPKIETKKITISRSSRDKKQMSLENSSPSFQRTPETPQGLEEQDFVVTVTE
jgi:hypothetical protein